MTTNNSGISAVEPIGNDTPVRLHILIGIGGLLVGGAATFATVQANTAKDMEYIRASVAELRAADKAKDDRINRVERDVIDYRADVRYVTKKVDELGEKIDKLVSKVERGR